MVTAGRPPLLRLPKLEVQLFLNRVCASDRCSGAFRGPVLCGAVAGRSGGFRPAHDPQAPGYHVTLTFGLQSTGPMWGTGNWD